MVTFDVLEIILLICCIDIYITVVSSAHNVCAKDVYIAIVSTIVETEWPENEIKAVLHLLGTIYDKYVQFLVIGKF